MQPALAKRSSLQPRLWGRRGSRVLGCTPLHVLHLSLTGQIPPRRGISRTEWPVSHLHVLAQEGPSLDSVQEHYKGQKDPACLLKQKRSSIWAGLQLPSLCWD